MKEKIKSLLSSVKQYWTAPPKGRYMSFREITSLSVGGMGVRIIAYCIDQMIISVGNGLIGNTIGINPSSLYIIYILGILSSFPLTALRAKMIDNTRSMKGKYRPYIISMGIPTVILGIGFILMPYEKMSMPQKCVTVLLFNIGFQFFYNFFTDAYTSLINVLSPNSIERSDVLSIRSVVENFTPSIATIFLPLVAKLITGQNTIYDLKIYRVLFPPMLTVGFVISLLVYVNTQEKIVQAKTHVVQMKFIDAFRAIARNKYFWVISLAGWLGFLENAFDNILGWMYNYQAACTAGQYSIITAIAGNAAFWPNLVAPFFIRKYGKRKILVISNILNIGLILAMMPIVRMTQNGAIIWFLLAITFANRFVTCLGHLLNPSIQGDIRDYQQYVTGERIDGMFAAVGLIGNVVTLATSSVLPTLYEKAGLNANVAVSLGYSANNVYDVLYNREFFVQICSVLIIASVVGAIMNVIPFFFYDLSETDQKGMVSVLKIRALFEDYGNKAINDDSLIEAVEIINQAREYFEKEITPADKSSHTKEELKAIREENEKILIARRVMDELNKYDTVQGQAAIETAGRFVEAGVNGFMSVQIPTKKQAKALPKETEREKEIRRNTLIQIESVKTASKAKNKYYPNGITEFDKSVFEKLFKAEDENEEAINALLSEIKKAKEAKDKDSIKELKANLKALQSTRDEIGREIKKATEQNSIYYRAAKPYLDAKRTLDQSELYKHLDDIFALYSEAVARKA